MKFQASALCSFLADPKTDIHVQSMFLLKTFSMLLFFVVKRWVSKGKKWVKSITWYTQYIEYFSDDMELYKASESLLAPFWILGLDL